MKIIAAILIGMVFATGLTLSGMTLPQKVLGFLDVFGAWDPSLAFVMGSAVLVSWSGYRLVLGKAAPLLVPRFELPTATRIDLRLVAGAALFGLGWGLVGFCPGPAVANLASGETGIFVFVAAMIAGFRMVDFALPQANSSLPEGSGA